MLRRNFSIFDIFLFCDHLNYMQLYLFALYKIKRPIKLSTHVQGYQNIYVNYFFITSNTKLKQVNVFARTVYSFLWMLTYWKSTIFCTSQTHAHDSPTPVHSLFIRDVRRSCQYLFPCMTRLWYSVPAHCFCLSYSRDLFKGNISMHLAALKIT